MPDRSAERGTRDQLHLRCVSRAVEAHAGQAAAIPFIADELPVNFDDRRIDAALTLLGRLGRTTQAVVFAHHERIVDMARRQAAAAILIIMPSIAPSRWNCPPGEHRRQPPWPGMGRLS